LNRVAPGAKDRVLAAYPDYPRKRALVAFGSDVMFGAQAWAFADAYSANAPTHVYRFDHFGWSLRLLGLGATHGSEIVHIQHNYACLSAATLPPRGGGLPPPAGSRARRSGLALAAKGGATGKIHCSSGNHGPTYTPKTPFKRITQPPPHPVAPDPHPDRR